MKRISFVAAVVVVFAPSVALAEGCGWGHQKQAMSCPEGQIYDASAQTCVPSASS